MAQLTAEDVVLKKFQQTKFREGYDQVEVDDFLDEVAATMRELVAENDDLKAQLAAAQRRMAELAARPGVAAPPMVQPPAVPAPMVAQQSPAIKSLQSGEPETATGMLALAQKLHDEYVRAGQEEGEQILSDAKVKAANIVREAEETSVRTLAKLEKDRTVLERKIDELRVFEADYRGRLKGHLESLLSDLDGKVPMPEVAQSAGGQPFGG